VDTAVIRRLQARIPNLTMMSAGGIAPFVAEGGLCGLSFVFRYQRGRASLRVGGDMKLAWLYEARRPYGHPLGQTLRASAFEVLMLVMVPELRRADRMWQFEGLLTCDSGLRKKGEACRYSAIAPTAEEALNEILRCPDQYRPTLRYRSPAEDWAAEITARQINPRTVTIDRRIWPDPAPQFVVLPSWERNMELESLPEVQLFARNEQVRAVRDLWVAAMFVRNPAAQALELECRLRCEEVVNLVTSLEAGPRAQIGLLIAMALARRAGGRLAEYENDLQDALTYAFQARQDDLVEVLERAVAAC
jgi:hypothetical protein